MSNMTRRELGIALSAFAAMTVTSLSQAQGPSHPKKSPAGKTDPILSRSQTFPYNQLPVTRMPNGGAMRKVISGVLATGEFIEVHETTLPAGQMPHPPHRHRNSELLFIREGSLEYLNNGVPEPIGPGGVVFTASNVLHGLKNVGKTPANYFVIAISRA
jgi:mannose-6-phosphate isomerase-like protein (cupin superfamily)